MLKPRAAFLVEIDDQANLLEGQLAGRIEHVLSGARDDFESPAALLQFIARILARTTPQQV